jgi:hypothetical protein
MRGREWQRGMCEVAGVQRGMCEVAGVQRGICEVAGVQGLHAPCQCMGLGYHGVTG